MRAALPIVTTLACLSGRELGSPPSPAPSPARDDTGAATPPARTALAAATGAAGSPPARTAGLVDVALAPAAAAAAPGLRFAPLYEEQGVFVVRRGNRNVGARLDRATFEALPYVDVQVVGGSGVGSRLARGDRADRAARPRLTTVRKQGPPRCGLTQGQALP